MSSIEKSFQKLKDLTLREQLFNSCSSSLVTFLTDRKYSTVDEMVDNAERYQKAHPGQALAAKSGPDVWSTSMAVDYYGAQNK